MMSLRMNTVPYVPEACLKANRAAHIYRKELLLRTQRQGPARKRRVRLGLS